MKHPNLKVNSDPSDQFESEFASSLRAYGFNIPINEDEVTEFEKHNKMTNELDFSVPSPFDILKNGPISHLKKNMETFDKITAENLAMAAREGGDISEDVKKKMEADRKKAKNKRKAN